MPSRSQLADQLRAVPLFTNCSRSELKTLAKHTNQIDAPAGTVVVREGDPGDSFYVVISGRASVRHDNDPPGEVATLGPGGFFGELALLDPAPRNATVTITEAATLGEIHVRVFRAMLRDVPALSEKLLAVLAQRLREAGSQS